MGNVIIIGDFMEEPYKRCLENADKYIQDSIHLRDKGSYGHAFALAVIGQEEVAKAWGYFGIGELQELGDREISAKWIKGMHVHENKIEIGLLMCLTYKLITDGIREVEKELPGLKRRARLGEHPEKLTKEALEKILPPIIMQISEKREGTKRESKRLQDLKEKGLYADINITGEITEKEVNEELDKLKENRSIAEKVIQHILSYPKDTRSKVVRMWLNLSSIWATEPT